MGFDKSQSRAQCTEQFRVIRDVDRRAGEIGEVTPHRHIACHAAAKDQRLQNGPPPQNRVGDISGEAVTKSVTNRFQAMPFLLGMDEIGLRKHGTARRNAGARRRVFHCKPAKLRGIRQIEAPGLLIEEGTGPGGTGRAAAAAEIPAVFPQPDQMEFLAADVEDASDIRSPTAGGRDTADLIVEAHAGPHGFRRGRTGGNPYRPGQVETRHQFEHYFCNVTMVRRISGLDDTLVCCQLDHAHGNRSDVDAQYGW